MTDALCAGQWALFDSTNPADHREAAALCRECPMILTCRKLLEEATLDRAARHGGPQGTWAGLLIRSKTGEVVTTAKCPACGETFTPRNGSIRYCSPVCAAKGRSRSGHRYQQRRVVASACIDCAAPTGGARCRRCQAIRASNIAAGRAVA